ncbi:MAG: BON domain-containing protein [Thermoguttaceae bacterium]
MHVLTVPDCPLRFEVFAEAARERLRGSPYGSLRTVSCECKDGVLFLRGRLSSFYHKQLAQEVVARIVGVTQVINEIEVD